MTSVNIISHLDECQSIASGNFVHLNTKTNIVYKHKQFAEQVSVPQVVRTPANSTVFFLQTISGSIQCSTSCYFVFFEFSTLMYWRSILYFIFSNNTYYHFNYILYIQNNFKIHFRMQSTVLLLTPETSAVRSKNDHDPVVCSFWNTFETLKMISKAFEDKK